MKKYQHESSLAKQKQKLGTAKEYYKSVLSSKGQARMKFDFGYFLMLSGRAALNESGGIDWTVSGAGGGSLLFSFDYTQQMSLGPVPFYVNINFSASAGVCLEGLYFSFTYDYDGNFHGMEWWIVRGVTIDIRLALTVTLGIGVKGICSVWVSATGALNIILTFMNGLPMHVAVYAEIIISVGFEIFWIKYSKAVSDIPKWKIWSNYNLDTPEKKAFALFTALADTPEPDEAALTPLEPERYPQLTPVAEKVMENEGNSRSGIKVIEHNGETYIFYLTQSPTKGSDGKNHRRIGWLNTKTGEKGDIQPILNGIRYSLGTNVSKDKDDYAFDVKSNDGVFAIVACCASQFAEKGEPVESNINNKNIYYYMLALEADAQGNLVISDVKQYFTEEHLYGRSLYPILNAPQIEGMSVKTVGYYKRVELYGAFQNYSSSRPENTGYVPFYMKAQSAATLSLRGASGIKSGMGDDYIRVGLRTGAIAEGNYWDNSFYYLSTSSSWVALSKKGDPLSEDGAIEMYDWDMNIAPEGQRRSVVLAQGDIVAFAVLQSLNQEGTGYSQTIFYTQNETLEDRTDKRLKGIYIAPKQGGGTRNIRFDMTYTDYDLNIPATDFRAVTLGTSQYLYWLSTVTKEKESDPDVWRITGVYYDSATNSISDQIVIAEFILPDSQWNGTTYRSVPFEIMLTEKGTGYIAAKPDTENEDDHAIAPLTLYSFPITLKPVANLTGASLSETTVCQGELITADLAVMNEGNMGIGSFDVELWLTENGREVQKIETLHANCLNPNDSTLVLHQNGRDETVVSGEAAFYRLKDFQYSPRQREWIVKSQNKSVVIQNGTQVTDSDGSGQAKRLVTNVLVPGALGGYTGSIKIPTDWKGKKTLRLKLVRESTYSNWLAAAALAQSRPELFAEDTANGGALFAADAAEDTLEKLGIQKLVYELDGDGDRLVLQQPKGLFEAGSGDVDGKDETVSLYATEIEAPKPVDINCDVHDIDVGHRLWTDYYGEAMLDIIINNYHTTQEAIELTCAVYLDNSDTPRYVSLPYDQSAISAGKTTTITLPLKTFIPDADQHREARVIRS